MREAAIRGCTGALLMNEPRLASVPGRGHAASMVSAAEITDSESLAAWLDGQAPEVVVQIAYRAAMRVAPMFWKSIVRTSAKTNLTSLTVLRFCLISSVAGTTTTPEIRGAAARATETAEAAATKGGLYLHPKAGRAGAGADAAVRASVAGSARYAINAARAADGIAARAAAWEAVQEDAKLLELGHGVDAKPLWPRGENPLSEQWESTRTAWQARGSGWHFWIDWYEDALAGRPPNWGMLKETALIDPGEWDKSPEHVNSLIAEIRLRYAVKDTPNAEVVSFNEATGRLRVDPVSEMPPDYLAEAVEKLQSILTLFDLGSTASNQFRPVEEERGIIQKAASEYAARPRLLHSACVRVVKRLNIKIANGECPEPEKDANIADFYGTVAEVSADLFERDPLVKEAATAKGARKLPDATGDAAATLVNAADEVAEASEGDLAAELPEQARAATDAAATQFERKEAFYVLASRLLRVWLITGYRAGKGTLEEIEALSRTTAGICKNAAVIGGSGAVLSSPVWLQPAVQYILSLM